MKAKKNNAVDISSKSLLYFQVGLAFVLGITYLLINLKVYEKELEAISGIPLFGMGEYVPGADIEESVPATELKRKLPPPPPKQIAPPPEPVVSSSSDKIEIVEDKEEIIETLLESTEVEMDEDIEEEEPDFEGSDEFELGGISVPFAVIESVPVYPGCEKYKTDIKRRKCMMKKITNLVNRHFNTRLANQLNLTGVNRINVQFKIDQYGNVKDILAQGPHPRLEQEAVRVVKKIPSMRPGKKEGKPVPVVYVQPIVFMVE